MSAAQSQRHGPWRWLLPRPSPKVDAQTSAGTNPVECAGCEESAPTVINSSGTRSRRSRMVPAGAVAAKSRKHRPLNVAVVQYLETLGLARRNNARAKTNHKEAPRATSDSESAQQTLVDDKGVVPPGGQLLVYKTLVEPVRQVRVVSTERVLAWLCEVPDSFEDPAVPLVALIEDPESESNLEPEPEPFRPVSVSVSASA